MNKNKPPIVINFKPSNLGRVNFELDVRRADGLSHRRVMFKLDSGSDFTTLSMRDFGHFRIYREFSKILSRT